MALEPREIFFRLKTIHRILIVVGICVLLLVAFYFLWVAEDLQKVSALEKQIGSLKLEIINQEKILARRP